MSLRTVDDGVSNRLRVLSSEQDRSVNFVEDQRFGSIESRFVRKCAEYFICYLSSQTGCNRGCTFCHLTATRQTSYDDVDLHGFLRQARRVLSHYHGEDTPAKFVHFNFMARGEPFASYSFLENADEILTELGKLAAFEGLASRCNVSTIMPLTTKKPLREVFRFAKPTIYYSLYSMDEAFRRARMPGAMDPREALARLKSWQDFSGQIVKIHFPLIAGVNDSVFEIGEITRAIQAHDLRVDVNLIRYNPPTPDQGVESTPEVYADRRDMLERRLGGNVQIIPRVGFDVKASCGMFVDGNP